MVASQSKEAGASGDPLTVYQILFKETCAQDSPVITEVFNAETSTSVVLLALPSERTEQ